MDDIGQCRLVCSQCHRTALWGKSIDSLRPQDLSGSPVSHMSQATLAAAQEAMITQAEEMRKVTAERDALLARLLSQASASRPGSPNLKKDGSLIGASYDSTLRPSRALSGEYAHGPCVHVCHQCKVGLMYFVLSADV